MNLNSFDVVETVHDKPTRFLFVVYEAFCVMINSAFLMVKVLNDMNFLLVFREEYCQL